MSQYFALVNSENLVEQVIEGDENFVSLHPAEAGKQWVETFINDQDGKNYAGVGYTYDPGMNDFIPPKPYPSWVQNGNTWEPLLQSRPAIGNGMRQPFRG